MGKNVFDYDARKGFENYSSLMKGRPISSRERLKIGNDIHESLLKLALNWKGSIRCYEAAGTETALAHGAQGSILRQ